MNKYKATFQVLNTDEIITHEFEALDMNDAYEFCQQFASQYKLSFEINSITKLN